MTGVQNFELYAIFENYFNNKRFIEIHHKRLTIMNPIGRLAVLMIGHMQNHNNLAVLYLIEIKENMKFIVVYFIFI